MFQVLLMTLKTELHIGAKLIFIILCIYTEYFFILLAVKWFYSVIYTQSTYLNKEVESVILLLSFFIRVCT